MGHRIPGSTDLKGARFGPPERRLMRSLNCCMDGLHAEDFAL